MMMCIWWTVCRVGVQCGLHCLVRNGRPETNAQVGHVTFCLGIKAHDAQLCSWLASLWLACYDDSTLPRFLWYNGWWLMQHVHWLVLYHPSIICWIWYMMSWNVINMEVFSQRKKNIKVFVELDIRPDKCRTAGFFDWRLHTTVTIFSIWPNYSCAPRG